MSPPATILVVEDNPLTRKMLRVALATEGHTVLEAGTSAEALAISAGKALDMAIVDFVLPDMDGLSLLSELRAQQVAPTLPALLLTGMTSRIPELQDVGGPQTYVVAKPIEPATLLELVCAQLSAHAATVDGPRILVVDDDPLSRKLSALCLTGAGFTVETAASGAEALAMARRRPPDAIVADVMMPGLDGFGLCLEIRRDAVLAQVPVILASASYGEQADRELAARVGASALMTRGPNLHEVIVALNAKLGTRGPPPPLADDRALAVLHRERVQAQLERQAERSHLLLRQGAIQAAALSAIRGLSEALAKPEDAARVVSDVLVNCLDAAGLSTGLLYLLDDDSPPRVEARFGLPAKDHEAAESCFGEPDFLRAIALSAQPTTLSEQTSPDAASRFVKGLGHRSALAVPFSVLAGRVGVLVLASDTHDLLEPAWTGFAHILSAQFGQTVALAESLTRLASSESRYRALMEQAHDAIMIIDLSRRITEANRQAERVLGLPRAALIGRAYHELVATDELADSGESWQRLLATGATRVERRTIHRQDGTTLPVEISASLVQPAGGAEPFALVIGRDITERQRAERAVREAQDRLAHIVASNPALLFTLRPDGERMATSWFSANIERFLGYSAAEALALDAAGDWWPARVHPADRELLAEGLAGVLARGDGSEEFRFLDRAGRYRWIRAELRVLRDAAGNVYELVGSWSDVGDRKDAELKLSDSEEQYRLLFDSNPHPMWVFDAASLAFLAVNEAAIRHYGYSRDQFLAMTIADVRPPDEVPHLHRWMAEHQDPLEARAAGIFRHRKRDGSVIEVEVSSSGLIFRGRPARLVLALDVTEKRSLQSQLLLAQKMESVGRLAGGIAHDFNNLLGIMMGSGDLIRRQLPAGSPLRRHADDLLAAADRAAGLTRQLLAFSRRQVLQPRALDLNRVVADVEKMLRRLIGEDVELVTRLSPAVGVVLADAGQLEQVIMNLVVNARDALPQGGRIVIETTDTLLDTRAAERLLDAAPGRYAALVVRDNGHGIPPDVLSRIFEPFFTTKESGRGTGLGLSTVHGIVRQSGGQITVASTPGEGSVFTVLLPVVEASPVQAAPSINNALPRGNETILVVEDESLLLLIIAEHLTNLGYVVLEATNPRDAVARSQSFDGPIHLLLTDVVLPGGSGTNLARELVRSRPAMRLLFMSGFTTDQAFQSGLRTGMPLLDKPFTATSLAESVRATLDQATPPALPPAS
jgi:PAS domain S-box-containing protein